MQNFVYHRVVENMQGKILYPLNQLKEIHPEIYTEHVKKYAGREQVLEAKIPTLDCLWNDVIHFTAVSPQDLYENLKKGGMKDSSIVWSKWYKVPVSLLDPQKTTICLYRRDISLIPFTKDFSNFDPEKMETYRRVPNETIEYYKEQFSVGKRPLMFHLVPHILYKGTIDTEGLEIIEV